MSIPSLPASTTAPVAAPRTGAPAAQAGASIANESQAAAQLLAQAASPLDALLAVVRQSAAARQDGLSTLMANALVAAAGGKLPPQVQSAVALLMDLHLPSDRAPDADTVKTAILNSGLFTEATLAAGEMPRDLKTALLLLNAAAQRQAPGQPAQSPPSSPQVPPPVPGGRAAAQPVAAATLPAAAGVAEIAKQLAAGSDAALARQTLLQIGSLPEPPSPQRTADARWIVDLPLMTPQGSTVAQLVIERDGRNATPDAPKPVWRVQLAMDIAPLGPVRATMALSGTQTWVMLHAEKDETVEKLRREAGWLANALQESELEANIAVEPGHAAQPAGGGTRLVDHAS